jgi:hypothetical protein
VRAVGRARPSLGALLHEQDRGADLTDLRERLEDPRRRERRQAERRLVEEQDVGASTRARGDRELLLLAAESAPPARRGTRSDREELEGRTQRADGRPPAAPARPSEGSPPP